MTAEQQDFNGEPSMAAYDKVAHEFWHWHKETFTPYVIADYANVCLKALHGQPTVNTLRPAGDEESPLSVQNRLRNVPRTYKREMRFKIISLYAKPFGLPWTQTFAQHMLRMVFGTTGSAVSLNSAFASSTRTSKDRVDFKPVLHSLNDSAISFLNTLYDLACEQLESSLLPQAMAKAQRLATGSSGAHPKPNPKSVNAPVYTQRSVSDQFPLF